MSIRVSAVPGTIDFCPGLDGTWHNGAPVLGQGACSTWHNGVLDFWFQVLLHHKLPDKYYISVNVQGCTSLSATPDPCLSSANPAPGGTPVLLHL